MTPSDRDRTPFVSPSPETLEILRSSHRQRPDDAAKGILLGVLLGAALFGAAFALFVALGPTP